MATFVYAPGIRVFVDTTREGTIEITDDLQSANLSLNLNQPSSFSFVLLNHRRKYDGVFTPDDRISVQLKRVTWLQVFAGYLDDVPYFSVYPRSIPLRASCSLKRLQYRFWDAGAAASYELLRSGSFGADDAHQADGGLARRIRRLVTEVGGWPEQSVHIGEIPFDWFRNVADLYKKVAGRLEIGVAGVGQGPIISGSSPLDGAALQVKDAPRGAGVIPDNGAGRVSWFGGPQGGAYGGMNLTGESGANPLDPWYCAMRWPYYSIDPNTGMNKRYLSNVEERDAMNWWRNRKILVVNPKNNRAVVLRAADWGPRGDLGRVIDISQHALTTVLGANTDDTVQVRFAPADAALGPANAPAITPGSSGVVPASGNWSIPAGVTSVRAGDFAWGGYQNGRIPLDKLVQVVSPNGSRHLLHPQAAASYNAMRDDARRAGISLEITDAYRDYDHQVVTKNSKGDLAATPGTSNHGWAFALDLDANINNFGTPAHNWMVANAARYGWVLPPWAQQGGSKPEPWHWEFWAGLNYAGSQGGANAGGGSYPNDPNATSGAMLNAWQATAGGGPDPASVALYGIRALMNDTPLLPSIATICHAAQRQLMSAPNGDFIAWFPDYFGLYGIAGRMEIADIELLGDGFTIMWSDRNLVTHQFVAGAATGYSDPLSPGGSVDLPRMQATMGVASAEFPELMKAILNINENDPRSRVWLDFETVAKRFGIRPDYQPVGVLTDHEAEFWYAVWLFAQNWSSQFSAEVNLAFMPEVYPGMLLQFRTFGLQVFVEGVNHSIDFSTGFTTSVNVTAPSSITDPKNPGSGGLYALPRGGT